MTTLPKTPTAPMAAIPLAVEVDPNKTSVTVEIDKTRAAELYYKAQLDAAQKVAEQEKRERDARDAEARRVREAREKIEHHARIAAEDARKRALEKQEERDDTLWVATNPTLAKQREELRERDAKLRTEVERARTMEEAERARIAADLARVEAETHAQKTFETSAMCAGGVGGGAAGAVIGMWFVKKLLLGARGPKV